VRRDGVQRGVAGEVAPLAGALARHEPECSLDPQRADPSDVWGSVSVDRGQPGRVAIRSAGLGWVATRSSGADTVDQSTGGRS
jgi:hypothetical protein